MSSPQMMRMLGFLPSLLAISLPPSRLCSIHCKCRRGELLEVEILFLLDSDCDAQDLPALELAGRLVVLADRVAAVEADAEAVAGQRELARLSLHRPFGGQLVVDIEAGFADGLHVRTGLLAREFHTEREFARLELLGDELLFRLDAEKVRDVVELPVLDEERVPADARAVGEDDARAVRFLDFDVGDDLEGASARIDRDALGHWRGAGIVDIAL